MKRRRIERLGAGGGTTLIGCDGRVVGSPGMIENYVIRHYLQNISFQVVTPTFSHSYTI